MPSYPSSVPSNVFDDFICFYYIFLYHFSVFSFYLMHSRSRSGCLAGSSPALSVCVPDRCRCDFSTRSDDFYFYLVYRFFVSLISLSYLNNALFITSLIITGSSVNMAFTSVCTSSGVRVIAVNKQSSINHHLNKKKKISRISHHETSSSIPDATWLIRLVEHRRRRYWSKFQWCRRPGFSAIRSC